MALAEPQQPQSPVTGQPDVLYRLIAETIPHMVWTARADGWLDFFNRRVYEYTGMRGSELEGWGWKEAVHADEWERCLASWTRSLQTGERYEIEFRLRRADGAYRWHHGSAVPLREDAGGHIVHWFGTCTDIEAEVRSAQILESMVEERSRKLRETERRFELFMEHLPALAWIRDSGMRYSYANPLFEKKVNLTLDELLGRTPTEAHPSLFSIRNLESDRAVLRDGAPLQYVDLSPTGHWLKVKFPFPDAEGRTGVAGIALDITERSRLEASRLQAEERARDYAVEVRHLMDRLVVAQESERRRLADDLHDLIGQNLTALGIDLTALQQRLGVGDGYPATRIDAMRSLVEQTIHAIRGVMTGLRPPALEEYGLAAALRSYAADFGERTGMKASITVLGVDKRLVHGKELSLYRITQEAFTNCAKHSGGTAVHAQIRHEPARIQLLIEDDGRGFSDPVGARSAHRGGWGLSAMRERAESHGGSLRIEFPGRGTRLIVEIPTDDDPHPAA
jgi:two-component system sensor histidine kinase UhpB